MTSREVLVPALLCFIIQVALTPCVQGSDGQWHGSSSTIMEQILLKRSTPIQGLSKINLIPELVNLTLHATNNEITASWSFKVPTNLTRVVCRVTVAGTGLYVYQNVFYIGGLTCNTSYDFSVYPVDESTDPGEGSLNATVSTTAVPGLYDLALRSTSNEITAKWSVNDPKCFPDLRFRVTTAGVVDAIVSQNSYNISGLACNTSYNVKVSPVDAFGDPNGVSSNATIITNALELVYLTLRATVKGIKASWAMNDPKCYPDVRFRVTTAGVDQIVSQNEYNISGLACNTIYIVKVSPVDAFGALKGVPRNASVTTKGVPELVNVTLRATLKEITVSWSLKDFECFPYEWFRVTTAGVNQMVKQVFYNGSANNFYTISGLPCNTIYNVTVSLVDAMGDPNGASTNATITTREVPVLVNLTLRAAVNEITAKWAMKDAKCYPDVRFRIITAGVDQIVSQNPYNISGLACNTSYNVKISPVDAFGALNGASTNATITTKAVPELLNLTLQTSLYAITARWSLNDPKCFPAVRFRVTTAGVNQIVSQNFYNISGLACNTIYNVTVTPVDAAGATFGVSTNAAIRTMGVPQLVNLTLRATLYELSATWSLEDKKCFPDVRFSVATSRGIMVDNKYSFGLAGLACNTNYTIEVSVVYANGTSYGVSKNSTVLTMGVPVLFNLILRSTLYGITANWSLRDAKCFPGMRYRYTTAGVNQIVSQNSCNISGLDCNTNYNVSVSPVNAIGTSYGVSISGLFLTTGVPELVSFTLQESLNVITASWSVIDPKCFPDIKFNFVTTGIGLYTSQYSYNVSGLACNTSHNFMVTTINPNGVAYTYKASRNATIIVKGVPEVVSLALLEIRNVVTASWSLKGTKCFPDVKYRVTTAGVDKIVSQTSYNISGLACNTSYNINVSPVDASGVSYGVSKTVTIKRKGEPEIVNLTLQATPNGITARWSKKDPTCSPDGRFFVHTSGVRQIVSENFLTISGVGCDTSYYVVVSPINAAGNMWGVSANATIITDGVQVNLIAMVSEALIVKWAPLQGTCQNFVSYEVTLSLLKGAYVKKIITQKDHLVFGGLNASTVYQMRFQPLGARGVPIGPGVTGKQTTFDKTSTSGRCPFPTLAIAAWTATVMCAGVMKPTPSTNLEANGVCYKKYPATTENPYIALMYLVASGWAQFQTLQEYLRLFDYTEELLVNGYYKDGSWVWGFGTNYAGSFKIDPALLVGLRAGGDGPDDYKMLYADPKQDFRLNVAKDGRAFGGMICAFPVKV